MICVSFLLAACNPTKQIREGEVLLKKNKTQVVEGSYNDGELEDIYKQNANRRVLGFRLYLAIYNSVNKEKAQRKVVKKKIRLNRRNMRRMSKGKDSVEYSYTYREWLMYRVGEPPVILDTAKASKTRKQMELYLKKVGYFDSKVAVEYRPDSIEVKDRDTTGNITRKMIVDKDRAQAVVVYKVESGEPTKIISFEFESDDPYMQRAVGKLLYDVKQKREITPEGDTIPEKKEYKGEIQEGDELNQYKLDDERDRITRGLRDEGYWKFISEYIYYDVDTTIQPYGAAVTMKVKPWQERDPKTDSLIVRNHRQYKVDKVTFILDYDPSIPNDAESKRKTFAYAGPDSVVHYFKYKDTFNVNLDLLITSNFLRPTGEGFAKAKYISRSYNRVLDLGMYRSVNIQIKENDYDRLTSFRGHVNVTYLLTPALRNSLSAGTRAVHNSGFLGVEGNVSHSNRNMFGASENLTIALSGGLEAQPTLLGRVDTTDGGDIGNSSFFDALNTIEIGPSLDLVAPYVMVLPKKLRYKLSRSAMPFTRLSTAYNFQRRPDYTSTRIQLGHSIEIKEVKTKTHIFTIPKFRLNNIDKSDEFQARIDELNDQFLANSYRDYLAMEVLAYEFIYQLDDDPDKSRFNPHHVFVNPSAALAARVFFWDPKLQDRARQYFKVENTFIYRYDITERTQIATRFATGVGIPINDEGLPFDESFFSGGANTLRAWKARSVGPGTFFDPTLGFNKIGDVLIEGNVEYRFPLISLLELGLFIDAGNIWLITDDPLRPEGKFTNNFYKQFAVGGGVGFRFDFTFFIIRADLAFPLRDPALPQGERWIWQDKPIYDSWDENPYRYHPNLNIGIGYPF